VNTPDGKVLMVLPAWAGKLSGFTLLFEALMIQLCKHMPVRQVAQMVVEDERKLWRMLDAYVEEARSSEDDSAVTAVGMDETSIAKGHNYITLFVDLLLRRTIHVTAGKGSETVKAFVEDFIKHVGDPKKITDVSCDMSPAFIKGVREHLPNAKITFDKFHILKIIKRGRRCCSARGGKDQSITGKLTLRIPQKRGEPHYQTAREKGGDARCRHESQIYGSPAHARELSSDLPCLHYGAVC
jgi:transposase